MDVDQGQLDALLQRATQAEAKAAELVEAAGGLDEEPFEYEPVTVDELAVKVASLEATIATLEAEAAAGGFALEVDAGEVKGDGEMCGHCGSKDIDDFADGTARCSDCGYPVARKEAKADVLEEPHDFTDVADVVVPEEPGELEPKVDPDPIEVKADPVTEPGADDLDALLARRRALD